MSFATKRSRKIKTTRVPHVNASVAHIEMRHAALRTGGLPVLEDITHSSQGPNQRHLAVAVHLAPKTVDVHVDDIGVRLNAHAPYLIKNHGSRDHPAGIPAQVFKKHKFLRSQLQLLA